MIPPSILPCYLANAYHPTSPTNYLATKRKNLLLLSNQVIVGFAGPTCTQHQETYVFVSCACFCFFGSTTNLFFLLLTLFFFFGSSWCITTHGSSNYFSCQFKILFLALGGLCLSVKLCCSVHGFVDGYEGRGGQCRKKD